MPWLWVQSQVSVHRRGNRYMFLSHINVSLSPSLTLFLKIDKNCPGWCGSVDWEPACEPKGRWFNSQSGHMPGLRARSPVGGTWEATTHQCFSPSLSPPICLKINKILFHKNKKIDTIRMLRRTDRHVSSRKLAEVLLNQKIIYSKISPQPSFGSLQFA